VIDAQWAATGAAVEELDAELPVPPWARCWRPSCALWSGGPLRERIGDAARVLGDPALAPLGGRPAIRVTRRGPAGTAQTGTVRPERIRRTIPPAA